MSYSIVVSAPSSSLALKSPAIIDLGYLVSEVVISPFTLYILFSNSGLLLRQIQVVRVVVVVYPLPWPLLVGGVRCSRLWSTSQLLRPSGQQCSHSGGVCPQIQGRQCGAYVCAVEEMVCVVCVSVTERAYM